MRRFGESIGIAFQIRDDVLDYEGSSILIGKPVGGDIKEKKITLPLIYSLNQVTKSEAENIRKLIKNGAKKDSIKEIMEFVRKHKGIDYALEQAHLFSDQAKDSLRVFPDSQSKIALEALIDFVIDRKN
jgi:octaprenyl-diphosphate synthase